jgi:hypothetical protein
MTLDMECPKCRQWFPITEARHAVEVQCPECETNLIAEFRKVPAPAPGEPQYEVTAKAGKLPQATDSGSDTKRLSLDDDDNPKHKGGGAAVVVVSALSALLVAVGGLGATGYYLFTNLDVEETTSSGGYSSRNSTRSLTTPGIRANSIINQPTNPVPSFPTNPVPSFPTNPVPSFPTNPVPNFPTNPTPPPPKKVDRFQLKPVSGSPPEILPASLATDPAVIDLGGRVGASAVGGGGRYVVMHFPERGLLGVFDASEGRMRTGVAGDRGDVKVAAGLSWVVTFAAENKIFRVYTLPNLERKTDATIDLFAGVTSMAMGCNTNGPLLVSNPFGDLVLLDVSDSGLKEVEGARKKPGAFSRNMRALPDGTAFLTFDGFPNRQSRILTEVDRDWKVVNLPAQVTATGHDGKLYGDGVVYDRNGIEQRFGTTGVGSGTWYVPAVSQADYFLKIAPTSIPAKPRNKQTLTVTVHATGKAATPIVDAPVLTNVSDFDGMCDVFRGGLRVSPEQHFFLFPQAKLLAILSGDRTKLMLRKYELK